MKKLLLSIIMMLGLSLSFNVNAGPTAAGYAFQPWAVPVVAMLIASQQEYKACNNAPYLTAKWATGSNYYFDITQCEYDAKPSAYTLK